MPSKSEIKGLAKQIKSGKVVQPILKNSLVEFEDEGQDFLQWLVAPDGTILDCGPFQFDVWSQSKVTATSTHKVTGKTHIHITKEGEEERVINHPVASILPTTEVKLR